MKYQPRAYNSNPSDSPTTIYTASEILRQKILALTFNMNNKVSLYLQYKKVGKQPPMACEEAQEAIQEFYSLMRESIVRWVEERRATIKKKKTKKNVNLELIKILEEEIEEDILIIQGLDQLDKGENAKDTFIIKAKRFLNKYAFQRGHTRLEISKLDPFAEYGKEAYGLEEDE